MATITTYQVPDTEVPALLYGVTPIVWTLAAANGIAASADVINVAELPAGADIVDCYVSHSATLGASATLKLALTGGGDLTGATTAGGASMARMSVPPAKLTADTVVGVVVGGANITAAAGIKVVILYRAP